jgi:hypothetical protein
MSAPENPWADAMRYGELCRCDAFPWIHGKGVSSLCKGRDLTAVELHERQKRYDEIMAELGFNEPSSHTAVVLAHNYAVIKLDEELRERRLKNVNKKRG